jgi:hypothetical protein
LNEEGGELTLFKQFSCLIFTLLAPLVEKHGKSHRSASISSKKGESPPIISSKHTHTSKQSFPKKKSPVSHEKMLYYKDPNNLIHVVRVQAVTRSFLSRLVLKKNVCNHYWRIYITSSF